MSLTKQEVRIVEHLAALEKKTDRQKWVVILLLFVLMSIMVFVHNRSTQNQINELVHNQLVLTRAFNELYDSSIDTVWCDTLVFNSDGTGYVVSKGDTNKLYWSFTDANIPKMP